MRPGLADTAGQRRHPLTDQVENRQLDSAAGRQGKTYHRAAVERIGIVGQQTGRWRQRTRLCRGHGRALFAQHQANVIDKEAPGKIAVQAQGLQIGTFPVEAVQRHFHYLPRGKTHVHPVGLGVHQHHPVLLVQVEQEPARKLGNAVIGHLHITR